MAWQRTAFAASSLSNRLAFSVFEQLSTVNAVVVRPRPVYAAFGMEFICLGACNGLHMRIHKSRLHG
jgi:hypothetical protein